jgi:hypothetical protein
VKCFENGGEGGANRRLSFASLPGGLRTGRRFEHAVVGHHRHQRVEIVPVPGIGEAVQEREKLLVHEPIMIAESCIANSPALRR